MCALSQQLVTLLEAFDPVMLKNSRSAAKGISKVHYASDRLYRT